MLNAKRKDYMIIHFYKIRLLGSRCTVAIDSATPEGKTHTKLQNLAFRIFFGVPRDFF